MGASNQDRRQFNDSPYNNTHSNKVVNGNRTLAFMKTKHEVRILKTFVDDGWCKVLVMIRLVERFD